MSGGSSEEHGSRRKLDKTEEQSCSTLAPRRSKEKTKNFKTRHKAKLQKKVDNEAVKVFMMEQTEKSKRSNELLLSKDESNFNEDNAIQPEVHKTLTNGLATILASLIVIPSFARKPENSESRIDQLVGEASTSSQVRRSILREKDSTSGTNSESNKFAKLKQLWTRYSTKETKKSIVFVDQRTSDSSLESLVTLVGTSKPLLKSALRSSGSLRSASSSVRFSLPPETLRQEDNALMKIGQWEIVCDFSNEDITADGWTATWKTLRHTRLYKIVMCLTFGLIVPSFLVVPVLVYEDNSNHSTEV